MPLGDVTLILGGARSGKSRRALELARAAESATGGAVFVATCPRGIDQEMAARIDRHQDERGPAMPTLEGTYDLGGASRQYPGRVMLLDCLTLWLYVQHEQLGDEPAVLRALEQGLSESVGLARWIIVSSEVGLGIVPETPLGREFRDLVGRANQFVAARATNVEFMVAGLPMTVKGRSLPQIP